MGFYSESDFGRRKKKLQGLYSNAVPICLYEYVFDFLGHRYLDCLDASYYRKKDLLRLFCLKLPIVDVTPRKTNEYIYSRRTKTCWRIDEPYFTKWYKRRSHLIPSSPKTPVPYAIQFRPDPNHHIQCLCLLTPNMLFPLILEDAVVVGRDIPSETWANPSFISLK